MNRSQIGHPTSSMSDKPGVSDEVSAITVDLYFIINKYSFQEVVGQAKQIFGNEFNEKLFREQLSYFEDIDYSEEVNYEGVFGQEYI